MKYYKAAIMAGLLALTVSDAQRPSRFEALEESAPQYAAATAPNTKTPKPVKEAALKNAIKRINDLVRNPEGWTNESYKIENFELAEATDPENPRKLINEWRIKDYEKGQGVEIYCDKPVSVNRYRIGFCVEKTSRIRLYTMAAGPGRADRSIRQI